MKDYNPPGRSKKRVLLVEANEDNGVLMIHLLRYAGYECVRVETIAEGLRLARSERFDLYLLEIWYADGTGIELCKRIREFDARTPIIFFSAWTPRSARDDAIDAGADAYILKPEIEYLMLEIERWFKPDREHRWKYLRRRPETFLRATLA